MRLDLFLKQTGLVKQRSLAKTICDRGLVTVDGRVAKAAKELALGMTVALELKLEYIEFEVLGLPKRNYRRKEGEVFYRIISHERKEALF